MSAHDMSDVLEFAQAVERGRAQNVADWLDTPDEADDYIVDGLFEAGENVAIVGSAKAGKSFLALQLAICIAAGVPFLAHAVPRPRRVLMANLEISARQYKRRTRAMVEAFDIPREILAMNLFVENLKNEDITWAALRADALAVGAEVLMIDPFYQIFKGDEIDQESVIAAIDEMKEIQKSGVTLIMVYHAPKGFNGDRNLRDMVSGSSILVRYPEALLGILCHADAKELRVFDTVLRHPPIDEVTARFDGGVFVTDPTIAPIVESAASRKRLAEMASRHGAGQGSGGGKVGRPAQAQSAEERAAQLRIDIAGAIYHAGDAMLTRREVLAAVKVGMQAEKNDALNAMLRDGDLVLQDELVYRGGELARVSPRQGGRTFVTTPTGSEKYKAKLMRGKEAADNGSI
jgi:hypothetical protein